MANAARAGAAVCAAVLLAACSEPAPQEPATAEKVTVLAQDSWSMPAKLRAEFERQTGYELVVRSAGADAEELARQLTSKKTARVADAVIGVDTATAKRVLDADVLDPYTSPDANKGQHRFAVDNQQRLSAVDLADVCVNVDTEWFDDNGIQPPESFADLTEGTYADLLVMPDPAKSVTGQGFVYGTVASMGADGAADYWRSLGAGGVKVASKAYKQFSGGSKSGERPIVVAPASAPARDAAKDAETEVVADTCYRNVRYAGVLAGSANAERAQKLIDFLLSGQYQAAVPEQFGTYPTREGVKLPDGWESDAPQQPDPETLEPSEVAAGQQRWLSEFKQAVGRRG